MEAQNFGGILIRSWKVAILGGCLLYIMKKNKLPVIGKVQDINNEANKLFAEQVFMPMVTFAGTLMVFAVMLDYTFQLIEAIDWLTLNS